jgi:transcriptional activator of cad operon
VSTWVDEPLAPAPRTTDVAETAPRATSRRRALLALGITACFAVPAALWYGGRAGDGRSVAVLPFLDLTTQEMNEEYLADGTTEATIDKLAQVQGLRVAAPTASFFYKGKQVPVAEIGESLRVTYLLDGSLRESGATMRVATRLIRAADGYVVWSATYDRPKADKLKLQDEIADEVARALNGSIK